jgi:hypothetical protein
MGYGISGHLGICFQDSFGTANVGSFHYFPLISESLVEAIPPLESESIVGRYEAGNVYQGFKEVGGDVVITSHPILLGKLLYAWTFQDSSLLGTSEYTHTQIPATTDFDTYAAVPPMTIEVYRAAGSAHQYYDCLANQLTIAIAHGAIVQTTMSVIGGKFAKVVKTTPSYLSGSEYTWDQASISLAGVGFDQFSELTLTMNNRLIGKGTLDGTKTANRVKRDGFRMLEISGTLLFEDDTQFDNFRNATEQRLVVTIEGQDVASGYPAKFEADIPSMRFNEHPVNIGGPGLIEASFTAEARYNSGSGHMVKFTVVNSQPLYP